MKRAKIRILDDEGVVHDNICTQIRYPLAVIKERMMQITEQTTVKSILDAHQDALQIFLQHGVDVPSECDESILDTELAICDSMCHVDDLDGLMRDLQKFIDAKTPTK